MTRLALSVCLLLALLAADASAAGLLVPRDGSPPIAVKSHRISATVTDGLARTTLRQTFVNPGNRVLEAVYVFPLPEGAALVDVAMEVDGKRLEGLLVERKRARRVYNDIVRRRRDPALVEQIGHNTFRLSVFPVVPGKETVVELTWIQHLPLSQGVFRYVYPLALGGAAAKTEQDLTFSVRIESSAALAGVSSPNEGMDIATKGETAAIASLERTGAALDEDLVVEATVMPTKPTLAVSTWRDPEGDGYFLAVVTPPPPKDDEVIPRDVTLVLDTSGSMQGDKIEQAKRSALYLLSHLRATDRVNVLRFSSDVEAFADAPVKADRENLAKLREFVLSLDAAGGTAIGAALEKASEVPEAEGRVRTLVLLTDGRPTIGETDPTALVGLSKRAAGKGLHVYTFGVGEDLDGGLLRGLAKAGRGTAEIFRPGGEIHARLAAFLDRTASPVLADVEITVEGVKVRDLFPRPLPDAYLGEQVVVVGRYAGEGKATVTASAMKAGKRKSLSTVAEFRGEAGGERAVRDLYARLKLDFLEEALRLRTGLADDAYFAALDRGAYSTAGEIEQEIIAVSLETGVHCAYTSFLVLLPEDRARVNPRDLDEVTGAIRRAREAQGRRPAPATARKGEPREDDAPVADAGAADHNETDSDLPFEESRGDRDYISDAPFEGPSTNAAIGGGAGGAFGGRGGHRNLRAMGGGAATESSVDLGLEWLRNHQSPDGRWDSDGFMSRCRLNQCGGAGPAWADPAATGLAVLSFLGAGETHRHGRYKKTVKEGLEYLKTVQDPEGCFGPRTAPGSLLNHAVASLAMVEAYALTASPLFKQSAQQAVDFISKCRNPSRVWGPGVRPKTEDAAITTWALMALKAAKAAGLRVNPDAFTAVKAWLTRVTEEDCGAIEEKTDGLFPPASREAQTAAGILCRIFCGEDPRKSEPIVKATALCGKSLPAWSAAGEGVDLGYWYFGTLSMFQVGGDAWKRWNGAMKPALVDTQRRDGDEKGSWDPVGFQADRLGRIGATALNVMCLEVYYRYARVFGTR